MAWKVGITEAGDAGLDGGWIPWVEQGKPAVLISKNPPGVLKKLQRITNANVNVIVHCTITGLAGTALEPHTPPVDRAIESYRNLIALLGADRVVLRIDPVIPTDIGIARARNVLDKAAQACRDVKMTRVRVSFLDNYQHNRAEFARLGLLDELNKTYKGAFHAPMNARRRAWEELNRPATCAEPGFETSNTPCISHEDLDIFGVPQSERRAITKQRGDCGCLNKHELLTSRAPCALDCVFCYWKH